MLKMIGCRSSVISALGIPRTAIRPPWAMFPIMSRNAAADAGHLQAHVEPLGHPELALDLAEVALAWVDAERRAQVRGRARAGTGSGR